MKNSSQASLIQEKPIAYLFMVILIYLSSEYDKSNNHFLISYRHYVIHLPICSGKVDPELGSRFETNVTLNRMNQKCNISWIIVATGLDIFSKRSGF